MTPRTSDGVCLCEVMRKAFEGVAAFAIAIIIIIYLVYSSASPHPSAQPNVLTSGKRMFERKRAKKWQRAVIGKKKVENLAPE